MPAASSCLDQGKRYKGFSLSACDASIAECLGAIVLEQGQSDRGKGETKSYFFILIIRSSGNWFSRFSNTHTTFTL